jgi:hypothetical protein
VLCYLEGKSYDQAARELGWPKCSLTRRLSHARKLLRKRLVQSGVALSAGLRATALCEKVSGAPVGAMLILKTVKAAGSFSAQANVLAEAAAEREWQEVDAEKNGKSIASDPTTTNALITSKGDEFSFFVPVVSCSGGGFHHYCERQDRRGGPRPTTAPARVLRNIV